jgi:7-cyano-7-deazaguanine synthase in queuosine biosynthesis
MNSYTKIAREWVVHGLEQQNFISSPSYELDSLWEEMIDHKSKPKLYNPIVERPTAETVILVTGGLDSTTLYHYARKHNYPNIRALYIDIGHPYAEKELVALHNLKIDYQYFRDPCARDGAKYWDTYFIPARNFFLLSFAAELMEKGGTILFGACEEQMEYGGDKSKSFFRRVNDLFSTLPAPVKVENPLSSFTKQDEVEWLYLNGLPKAIISDSVSCYDPGSGNCGQCVCCLKKAMALAYWGIHLTLIEPTSSLNSNRFGGYQDKFEECLTNSDFREYPKRKCIQDLEGIRVIKNNDYDSVRKSRGLWP